MTSNRYSQALKRGGGVFFCSTGNPELMVSWRIYRPLKPRIHPVAGGAGRGTESGIVGGLHVEGVTRGKFL